MLQNVDLIGLYREIKQPSPIYFQQRANCWLSALRKEARNRSLIPILVGSVQLDVLDVLRSEMIIRNALGLANLRLAEALLIRFPQGRIVVDEKVTDFSVCDLARFVENGNEYRIKPQRHECRSLAAFHLQLYKAKVSLFRLGTSLLDRELKTAPSLHGSVLAIPRLPGHLSDILPVAHQLRNRHGVETVFGLVDRGMEKEVKQDGFETVNLLSVSGKDEGNSEALISATLSQFSKLLKECLEADLECEFRETEIKALSYITEAVLKSSFRHLVRVSLAIEKLVKTYQPSLIFASNHYTLEGRLAVNIARARQIPSASIEHGTIYQNDPMWAECGLDMMCVWGQPSRRALLSCGLSDQQIVVTGGPRFDEVKNGVPGGNKTGESQHYNVLVATSGPGDKVSLEEHKGFIRLLYAAASLTPNISWVVKLHKKDRSGFYQEIAPEFSGARVEIIQGERQRFGPDIFSFLASARAMVTICSTSALDAMLVGVPVISVAVNSNKVKGLEFLDGGRTIEVKSGAELAAAVLKIWNDGADLRIAEAARVYIAEHCANLGKASQDVADRMFALLSANHQKTSTGTASASS
jgi:hypothetical protein